MSRENIDKVNAQNKPQGLQRTEVFDVSKFDSDSIGLHSGAGFPGGAKDKSQPSSRRDNTREDGSPILSTTSDGRTNPKKLASQLELLKYKVYDYVGGHKGRLAQRLDEAEQFIQDFEKDYADLKQQIAGSLSASKTE